MNLRLRVTQNDINKGCRTQKSNCPIARALKRHKGVGGVAVGVTGIQFLFKGDYHFAELPSQARNFISLFDSGQIVFPFEFEIKPILVEKRPNNDSFP